ncbi:hypothetical protein M514_23386 [Trichuris suis]|uniref:Uncharacterized protein n=1 Tax=Trichuris suis TaxID=68888 RepID=A0A085N4G6_9BILA|nr:hypothetical protein M514_23386 [Trichuris suis]
MQRAAIYRIFNVHPQIRINGKKAYDATNLSPFSNTELPYAVGYAYLTIEESSPYIIISYNIKDLSTSMPLKKTTGKLPFLQAFGFRSSSDTKNSIPKTNTVRQTSNLPLICRDWHIIQRVVYYTIATWDPEFIDEERKTSKEIGVFVGLINSVADCKLGHR